MSSLVGKQEQREREPGTHGTGSVAGAMLTCLWVARAEEWGGNHHPMAPQRAMGSPGGRQGSG